MALQLQLRRGTTTEHSSFTGAVGEVTVDTSKNTLVLHDGVTAGGFPLTSSGEVVDNLTTNVSNKPLSAKQGKVLNESKVSNPTKILANADLNNYKTVGLYYCDTDTTTILNNPTQYGFSLFVEKVSDTAVNQKLVVHKDGGGKVYVRSFSTSWSNWNTVQFEKDVLGGTYKNVTSTRLPNVTYTNTSGKTIVLYVTKGYISPSEPSVSLIGTVDTFSVAQQQIIGVPLGANAMYLTVSITMIIPNNSTYRYSASGNSTTTVMELS